MADIELRPGEPDIRAGGRKSLAASLKVVWVVMHDATDGLFRHDGIMVASAVAFSLTFAMFPFAIFLVALGAALGGASLSAYISHEALILLPADVIRTLEPELNRLFVTQGGRPLTFGLLVTLGSITGAVEAIRDGLNRAYGCSEDRHLIRRYLSSLAFVFVAMAFLVTTAALGVALPIAIGLLDRYVPGPPLETQWIETGREAALVLIALAMLLALHLLLPAKRRRFSSVLGGVFLTLVLWWLAGKLFGLYISEIANYSATYAGLAGIVILMFFLYIQSVIFLYGAEMNRSIADYRGEATCRRERDEPPGSIREA